MFDEDLRGTAIEVCTKLRKIGRTADLYLSVREGKNTRIKLETAYSYAARIGAKRAILVAPDEIKKNQVRVKYLQESKGKLEKVDNEATVDLEKLFEK